MFHMPSQIGRYEIKTLIGAGGMGSLYLARDTNPNTSRLVVVKLLLANLDSGDLRARFAREARALAALNHPNIVDIYDSGEFQGSPYIVMEYIRGETLTEKIKRRAPMTLAQKVRLMVELCSGLSHAHESDIIHRDIKPANLMVDLGGRLKILDFGIARVSEKLTRAAVQVTQINMRIGTPGYMSPEQIEGNEIDARSDLFAVGTVCYELIAYREAFGGTNTRQIENRVLQTEPVPLASYVPELDPEVEGIIRKAMSKDPRDRFQSAAEMEQAFEQVRWRLGPETPIATPPRRTPTPGTGSGRKTDSRADAAYGRSQAFYSEGATEAARRFAIEALAEDPDHEDARTLVEQLGHRSWQPLPPRSKEAPSGSDPTVLRTEAEPYGTVTANAETVLSTGTRRADEITRETPVSGWRRHVKALQIAALVVTVAGVAVLAALAALYLTKPSGLMLTVQKPEGGTLVSDNGIRCGSGGNNCSVPVAENDVVEFQPEADQGYRFAEYTGDCAPFGRLRVRAASECGAVFTKNTVSSSPAEAAEVPFVVVPPNGGMIVASGAAIMCGKGKEDCAVRVARGTRITLSWVEDPDYIFKGWTGDCVATNGQATVQKSTKCGALLMRRSMPNRASARGSTAGGSGAPSSGIPSAPTSSASPPTPPVGAAAAPPVDPLRDRPTAPPVDVPGPPEPPEKPRPVRTPESIAKDEIADLFEDWRRAWEAEDIEAVKRLYPEASPAYIRSLSYQFEKAYKTVNYTYLTESEFTALNVALGTATVKRNTLLDPVYLGAGTGAQKLENVFTLKRFDGVWRIARVATKELK